MMSVLSDVDIRKICETRELLKGADLDLCLGPASYELRIGSVEDPATGDEILLEDGRDLLIGPKNMVLIGTKEEIDLPNDMCGFLKLKSSLGRAGFVSWDQGFIDPGYRGSLTIVLHNLTNQYWVLKGGQRVCHLVLMPLGSQPSKGYDGEYHGSVGATPTKSKSPVVISTIAQDMISEGTRAVARTIGTDVVKTLLS